MSKHPAVSHQSIVGITVMETVGALLILVADARDHRKRGKCRAPAQR